MKKSQIWQSKPLRQMESKEKGHGTACILSGFYSLGRVLSGITKCTSRNSGETGQECDRKRVRETDFEGERERGECEGDPKVVQPATSVSRLLSALCEPHKKVEGRIHHLLNCTFFISSFLKLKAVLFCCVLNMVMLCLNSM